MVGAAAGLALRGRIPVAHALATFLTLRAFEFIRTDVGIAGLPVKLVGGVPGFLSEANGPTHQAIEDVALMRGHPRHADRLPQRRGRAGGRPAGGAAQPRADLHPLRRRGRPGCAHRDALRSWGGPSSCATGRTLTVVTYGLLVARGGGRGRAAAPARGSPPACSNLRTLVPLDEAALLRAAPRRRLLVTVEDHLLTGGLFSIVAELFARQRVSDAGWCPFAPRGALVPARRCCRRAAHRRLQRRAPLGRARCSTRLRETARTADAAKETPCPTEAEAADAVPSLPDDHRVRGAVRAGAAPHPRGHPDPGQGARAIRARGGAQVPAARARAATSSDVDGNEFLDFNMAHRPAVAGLRPPRGGRRHPRPAGGRHHLQLMHPLEVEVAELIAPGGPGRRTWCASPRPAPT